MHLDDPGDASLARGAQDPGKQFPETGKDTGEPET